MATTIPRILCVDDQPEILNFLEAMFLPKGYEVIKAENGEEALEKLREERVDLVILVGEMRDLETISLTLTAAETGYLGFGTLHTINAPKTVDRVIDVFPPDQQQQIRVMFAESILAVISQVLLKKREGHGRIAALEIMVATTVVRNLIREGKTHQLSSIIQTSQKVRMQNMEQMLKNLAMSGKTISKKPKCMPLIRSCLVSASASRPGPRREV